MVVAVGAIAALLGSVETGGETWRAAISTMRDDVLRWCGPMCSRWTTGGVPASARQPHRPHAAATATQHGGLAAVSVRRVEWNSLVAGGVTLRDLFDGPDARPLIIVGGPPFLWPAKR